MRRKNGPRLYDRLPQACGVFPWKPLLVSAGSPVERIGHAGERFDLWVKRDEFCCPLYGGNKARKFEWILGEALAHEQTTLATVGGLCSNHCAATAIYGHDAGLAVTLGFTKTPLVGDEIDALKVQAFLGARQQMVTPALLLRWGLDPAVAKVPPAGSSVAGILGFVEAGLELGEQIHSGAMPCPGEIWIGAATGGSASGLAIGLALAELPRAPTVVAVETVTPFWRRARVLLPTSRRALEKLRALSPDARAVLPPELSGLALRSHFAGVDKPELGVVAPDVVDALADASGRGLVLEPHYSGRAFAALLAAARVKELDGKTILFWQTHGKIPEAMLARARTMPVGGFPDRVGG